MAEISASVQGVSPTEIQNNLDVALLSLTNVTFTFVEFLSPQDRRAAPDRLNIFLTYQSPSTVTVTTAYRAKVFAGRTQAEAVSLAAAYMVANSTYWFSPIFHTISDLPTTSRYLALLIYNTVAAQGPRNWAYGGGSSSSGGTISGSGAANQVTIWSAPTVVTGYATLTYDGSSKLTQTDVTWGRLAAGRQFISASTTAPTDDGVSVLQIANGTNASVVFGRTLLDARTAGYATFSNFAQTGTAAYALAQGTAGDVRLNAPTGQTVSLRINNSEVGSVVPNGLYAEGYRTLQQTLSGTNPTWTMASGALATLTLTGATYMAAPTLLDGEMAVLQIINGASALGFTISGVTWVLQVPATVSPVAGAVNYLQLQRVNGVTYATMTAQSASPLTAGRAAIIGTGGVVADDDLLTYTTGTSTLATTVGSVTTTTQACGAQVNRQDVAAATQLVASVLTNQASSSYANARTNTYVRCTAPPYAVYLPVAATVPAGQSNLFIIKNAATVGQVTVTAVGSDTITSAGGAALTTLTLNPGESLTVVNGTSTWDVV